MSEQSGESYLQLVLDVLFCCCRTRKNKSKAAKRGYSDESPKKANMRNGIPFEKHFSFCSINELPAPVPHFANFDKPSDQSIQLAILRLVDRLKGDLKAIPQKVDRFLNESDANVEEMEISDKSDVQNIRPIKPKQVTQRRQKRKAPPPPGQTNSSKQMVSENETSPERATRGHILDPRPEMDRLKSCIANMKRSSQNI